MDIRFVQPGLRYMDDLRIEALSAPLFADERPLRGTLGLVDWRMCGLISKHLKGGRLSGEAGELLLIPPRPRLSVEKLFLFGLGPMEQFDRSSFRAGVERIFRTLSKAKVRASVCVLPGRAMELIAPDTAMELFLEVAEAHPEHDSMTLVEHLDAQKAMAPIVERARKRARAVYL